MSARPVVDLPQPDSPTRPSVSPSLDVEAHVRHGVDLQPGRTDRELDDEVLGAQQHVVRGAQVRRAASGHGVRAPEEWWARSRRGTAAAVAPLRLVAGQRVGALGRADREPAPVVVARVPRTR